MEDTTNIQEVGAHIQAIRIAPPLQDTPAASLEILMDMVPATEVDLSQVPK